MSAQIIPFTGITRLNLPVEQIIDRAKEARLKEVIVLGYDEDGEFYFAGNIADGGDNLWLLETAKVRLLQCGKIIPEAEPE